jgi:hypothetical protein
MSRPLPTSVTTRVKDIKNLVDDLGRLQLNRDTTGDEMSAHIKREIDALVNAVNRLRR